MKRLCLFLMTVALLAQNAAQDPPKGSISGTFRQEGTGQPIANAEVSARLGPSDRPVVTTTDSQGRFILRDVPGGRLSLSAWPPFVQGQGFPGTVTRIINLAPGQTLEGMELAIRQDARLAGLITDQNDQPVPSVNVILISREYQLGQMRYIFSASATTDDEGKYTLPRVMPGRAYLLMVLRFTTFAKPISDAPLDPALRRPAFAPTFYPGIPTIEGSQTLTLQPGEFRENINLRVERTPSFCAEGSIRLDGGAGVAGFRVMPASPHSGQSGNGGMYMGGNSGRTGADGRFRVCDLAPGDYRVLASNQDNTARGSSIFTIKDKDVALQLYASPRIEIPGEIAWAEAPPQGFPFIPPTTWVVSVDMITDASPSEKRLSGMGAFTLGPLALDEYRTQLNQIPPDTYIREISYAGTNLIYAPLRPGTAVGEQSLRVILGRDGGRIRVTASNDDDKPSPDHFVTLVPVTVRSEIEFADAGDSFVYNARNQVQRQTDQYGTWTSPPLAPGKYYVYVSRTPFDRTPETVAKYWQVRDKAKQVEVPAKATIEAAVTVMTN